MRKMLLALAATAAATASFAVAPAAQAREGCGPNAHRGPRGHCIVNGRGYGRPVLVVGNFYQGRGYWDGRRYYQNRYRHHGGWRYR